MPDLDQAGKLLQERWKAIINLDLNYARREMPGASSDEVRLMALHKSRYELTAAPRELRHSSRHWLESRGLHRFGWKFWLPEGVLPGDPGTEEVDHA